MGEIYLVRKFAKFSDSVGMELYLAENYLDFLIFVPSPTPILIVPIS